MKKLKHIITVCLLLSMLLGVISPVAAKDKGDDYNPVDVVMIMDTSGSMKAADAERNVLKAVRMFSNMLPTSESRFAIVGFNDSATTYTTKNGKPAFFSLDQMDTLEEIHSILDGITYSRDTGIGYGLAEAVSLMESDPMPDHNKAMVLFSDGVDDLPMAGLPGQQDELKLKESQEKFSDAVVWATNNDCPIYTIGFNYQLADGKASLGPEGLKKLQTMSEHTGAYLKEVGSLPEIEDTFMDIVARICKLNFNVVDVIPGDGGHHEVPIDVTTGVIEMNIRIASNTPDAVKSGKIKLLTPDGDEFDFDGGKCFFDQETSSTSIKVLLPEIGQWTLVLEGITGDDVKVGLLNHFDIGIKAKVSVPKGNDKNTAFKGDKVTIVVKVVDKDGNNAEKATYDQVTEAKAVVTPRGKGEKEEEVQLTYNDKKGDLRGSYTASGESVADIKVTVNSPYFAQTADLTVENGNRPFTLNGSLDNQEVNVKKTVTIDDIYSLVSDPEGDPITASIINVENPDAADARVDGDQIVIEGKKWGSSIMTVQYEDAQGNTETVDFSVKVKDPVKIILLSMIPVILIIIGVIILLIVLSKSKLIRGKFTIQSMRINMGGRVTNIGAPVTMDAKTMLRGNKTMRGVLKKYPAKVRTQGNVTADQDTMLTALFVQGMNKALSNALGKIAFKGTAFGKNGFVLVVPKGVPVQIDNLEAGRGGKIKVSGMRELHFSIRTQDGTEVSFVLGYEQQGGRGGRGGQNPGPGPRGGRGGGNRGPQMPDPMGGGRGGRGPVGSPMGGSMGGGRGGRGPVGGPMGGPMGGPGGRGPAGGSMGGPMGGPGGRGPAGGPMGGPGGRSPRGGR